MNARIGVVMGTLLVGAVAWAQAPADKDKAEEVTRLKARLEAAELGHEVDREVLKESILLLKRAERDMQLALDRSVPDAKQQEYRLDVLKQYVEEERKRFEEQAVALESTRRELRAVQAPRPAGPAPATPRPAPAAKDLEELQGRVEDAQLDANLLHAQLILLDNALREQTNALAGLEVRAADTQMKGNDAIAKELQVARKSFGDARARYLELKKKHARAQRALVELQQRAGTYGGGFQ